MGRGGGGVGLVRDARKQGSKHQRVFDRLSRALALIRRGGVRGVAEDGDAVARVGWRGGCVPDGPGCEIRGFEELGVWG